ncbi:hypothetical protein [Lapillicoccus jejuensis]|uniref:hypothetical protein n=1 Tax=Lapillicoccus jejuensis TaxID=402171 RepID=UPI001154EE3A|nr:hypothetical protein [Lapillicoccus jejuensis]
MNNKNDRANLLELSKTVVAEELPAVQSLVRQVQRSLRTGDALGAAAAAYRLADAARDVRDSFCVVASEDRTMAEIGMAVGQFPQQSLSESTPSKTGALMARSRN